MATSRNLLAKRPDFRKLIFASSRVFNKARKDADARGEPRLVISTNVPISRDLSSHNLDGIQFYGCTFENCKFGSMLKIEYNTCSFHDCSFWGKTTNLVSRENSHLNNVVFFDCIFKHTSFGELTLELVQFYSPEFLTAPDFKNATIFQRITFKKIQNPRPIARSLAEAVTMPDSEVLLLECDGLKGKLSWETIRSLSKVPFLQVSLFSVTFLSVVIILLNGIELQSLRFDQACREVFKHYQILTIDPNQVCSKISNVNPAGYLIEILRNLLLSFTSVFFGALIHTSICPEEISEFSRANWSKGLRRPDVIYDAIATQRSGWLYLSLMFYVIGLCYILWKAGSAVYHSFL